MSITSDRGEMFNQLKQLETINYKKFNVSNVTPSKVEPYTIYLELVNVARGQAFTSLAVTWQVTATTSARLNIQSATQLLDQIADAIIQTLTPIADFMDCDEYFILTDNSSGGSVPSVRLIFTSQTNITEEKQ